MTTCPMCGADTTVRLGDASSEDIQAVESELTDRSDDVRHRCLACDHEWRDDGDVAR